MTFDTLHLDFFGGIIKKKIFISSTKINISDNTYQPIHSKIQASGVLNTRCIFQFSIQHTYYYATFYWMKWPKAFPIKIENSLSVLLLNYYHHFFLQPRPRVWEKKNLDVDEWIGPNFSVQTFCRYSRQKNFRGCQRGKSVAEWTRVDH